MKEHFSIFSFVAGFMLGIVIVGAYFLGDSSSLSLAPSALFTTAGSATPTATTSGILPLAEQSGAVAVADQSSGNAVTVAAVTVAPPGVWVAVREMNSDGLGNVLGALRVSGPRSDVSVPLLRATEPGKRYAVEFYRDDANGQFDPNTNSVYIDFDTSAPVIAYFSTNS